MSITQMIISFWPYQVTRVHYIVSMFRHTMASMTEIYFCTNKGTVDIPCIPLAMQCIRGFLQSIMLRLVNTNQECFYWFVITRTYSIAVRYWLRSVARHSYCAPIPIIRNAESWKVCFVNWLHSFSIFCLLVGITIPPKYSYLSGRKKKRICAFFFEAIHVRYFMSGIKRRKD